MINLQLLYIDPSVMTYAIQAIAGVAVAIGTVAVLLWRRPFTSTMFPLRKPRKR